jgi:hypothetical protein
VQDGPEKLKRPTFIGNSLSADTSQLPTSHGQAVGRALVRRPGATLQSSTRCSSEALSLKRSLPVRTFCDLGTAECSGSAAGTIGTERTVLSRNARIVMRIAIFR